MPVIQQADPFAVATEAVGNYLQGKRAADVDAAAQRYRASRDQRADMESDRTFGLQQGEAADAHRTALDNHDRTVSDLATADQNRKIAQANADYDAQARPLQLELDRINIKKAQGELVTQEDLHRAAQAELQIKTIQLQITKKYGIKKADLEVQQEQANIAQTNAQTAQARAQIGLIGAETANTQRSTALLGSGSSRMSARERDDAAYDSALESLSPQGQQFYNMLYTTNNPPTHLQALGALAGSGLNPADKKHLRTIIDSRNSQFITPQQQYTDNRNQQRDQLNDTRNTERLGEDRFRDLSHGRSFQALPPLLKDMARHVIVDQGLSISQAIDALGTAPIPDAQKAALRSALAGE